MDCGPASLKCLLDGCGITVDYGRLREACQTDVDGSSIDMIEEAAGLLGLDVEQTMIPADHLLLGEAHALPAMVVVRQPNGNTHFLVLWRRHGSLVQVMDPAIGRRWLSGRRLLDELYIHSQPVAASAWRDWAGDGEFRGALARRQHQLGLAEGEIQTAIDQALQDTSWRAIAALDAATRMLTPLAESKALSAAQCRRLLAALVRRGRADDSNHAAIPDAYWSVRLAPPKPDQEPQLLLRGAVLLRVLGRRAPDPAAPPLGAELTAALHQPTRHAGWEMLRHLRADGVLAPTLVTLALLLAAGGVMVEALLLRGLLDIGRDLNLAGQRMAVLGALVCLVGALALFELPILATLLRLGRRLETGLRMALLEKLPRLPDRYFKSRLTSDMAERGHMIHTLREIPVLGGQMLRRTFELILTAAGIAWLDPASGPLALASAMAALAIAIGATPLLAERDLKVRSHVGALSRFYFDALLGLTPLRAHGAEGAVRREHDGVLVEWARASLGLQRATVAVEALQAICGFGLAAWLLFSYLSRGGEPSRVLLLVYWALNLPVLAEEIALCARQYPAYRNRALRLLEPLGGAEAGPLDSAPGAARQSAAASPKGVAIVMSDVSVNLAGHRVLSAIDLAIAAGEHVAVVGASGAGKSTLVGLLLGWYRPAVGSVAVDGVTLDEAGLEGLRGQTAWVDPTVQLWNRSLLDNLAYGNAADGAVPLTAIVEAADLRALLEALPDGWQSLLGEGGALVSGGEGQRVRLARALRRRDARLVILDEPFRGLDRDQREALLKRARDCWREATLICITHDVGATVEFDKVIVLDHGAIAEQGAPAVLAADAQSRLRALLDAESDLCRRLWSGPGWSRLWLAAGKLSVRGRAGASQ